MKANIKIFYFAIAAVVAVSTTIYFFAMLQKTTVAFTITSSELLEAIGEVTDSVVVRQDFVTERPGLCGVKLIGATYGRINSGALRFSLYQEENRLSTTTVEVSSMVDNEFCSILFPLDFELPAGVYTLQMEAEGCAPGNAITFWKSASAQTGRLSLNGEKQEGALAMEGIFWVRQYLAQTE